MKCSHFFEVIFFGVFFGKVSGNLDKILRTPKNLPAPTPMKGYELSGLALIAKGKVWKTVDCSQSGVVGRCVQHLTSTRMTLY